LEQIRAFVGYSYLEKDEVVVASFLDFLDSQARDNPQLVWEHAKLSKANLAARYDEAGFFEEAEELCKEALSAKEVPEYANNVMLQISDRPEEERTKLKELKQRARTKSEFYSRFGGAMAKPLTMNGGVWASDDLELTVKFDTDSIRAEGVEFTSAITSALMAIPEGQQQVRYKVRVFGDMIGCAFVGTFRPIRETEAPRSILGDAVSSSSVMGYFDKEAGTLAIMVEPKQSSPKIRELHSQRSIPAIAQA